MVVILCLRRCVSLCWKGCLSHQEQNTRGKGCGTRVFGVCYSVAGWKASCNAPADDGNMHLHERDWCSLGFLWTMLFKHNPIFRSWRRIESLSLHHWRGFLHGGVNFLDALVRVKFFSGIKMEVETTEKICLPSVVSCGCTDVLLHQK